MSMLNVDEFVKGYVEAALWADLQWPATKDNPEPESGGGNDKFDVGDLTPESHDKVYSLCSKFMADNKADVIAYVEACESGDRIGYDPSQGSPLEWAGHDLWLSAGGHGAGFFDRGLGELGDRLQAAAQRSPWRDIEGSALPYVTSADTISFI